MCLLYLQLLLDSTDCYRLVQQQGLDGQALIGGSRGLEERSAQVVGLEDDNIVFPSVLHFFPPMVLWNDILQSSISAITTLGYLHMPRRHHLLDNPPSMETPLRDSTSTPNLYSHRINCCDQTTQAPQKHSRMKLALKPATKPSYARPPITYTQDQSPNSRIPTEKYTPDCSGRLRLLPPTT